MTVSSFGLRLLSPANNFKDFDTDGDGLVEEEELRSLGLSESDPAWMHFVDTSGVDGKVGLTAEEYAAFRASYGLASGTSQGLQAYRHYYGSTGIADAPFLKTVPADKQKTPYTFQELKDLGFTPLEISALQYDPTNPSRPRLVTPELLAILIKAGAIKQVEGSSPPKFVVTESGRKMLGILTPEDVRSRFIQIQESLKANHPTINFEDGLDLNELTLLCGGDQELAKKLMIMYGSNGTISLDTLVNLQQEGVITFDKFTSPTKVVAGPAMNPQSSFHYAATHIQYGTDAAGNPLYIRPPTANSETQPRFVSAQQLHEKTGLPMWQAELIFNTFKSKDGTLSVTVLRQLIDAGIIYDPGTADDRLYASKASGPSHPRGGPQKKHVQVPRDLCLSEKGLMMFSMMPGLTPEQREFLFGANGQGLAYLRANQAYGASGGDAWDPFNNTHNALRSAAATQGAWLPEIWRHVPALNWNL